MSTEVETFLMYDAPRHVFMFRMGADGQAAEIDEGSMKLAVDSSTGAARDVLVFLVQQARKEPGVWASASSEKLKPGQGAL